MKWKGERGKGVRGIWAGKSTWEKGDGKSEGQGTDDVGRYG